MKRSAIALVAAGHVALAHGALDVQPLEHFQDSKSIKGWRAVNDGVMGGLSSGGPSWNGRGLRFSGNLSLENNGGFSSIRKQGDLDLAKFDGIRLRVRGDGREYQVRLNTNARFRGWPVSYSGSFSARPNEWVEVDIPFAELEQSFRGLRLRNYPFDPSKIEMLGLMLADKRPGPFSIEVEWIQAYKKPEPGSSASKSTKRSAREPLRSSSHAARAVRVAEAASANGVANVR